MNGPFKIEFALAGTPEQQGSERIVYHGALCPRCHTKPIARITHANPRLLRWRQDVATFASRAMRRAERYWLYAVAVEFVFVVVPPKVIPKDRMGDPITFPDVDKLTRAAIDAMTGIVWKDDKQVTKITAEKRYPDKAAGEVPGVIVRAHALRPDAEAHRQGTLFDVALQEVRDAQ